MNEAMVTTYMMETFAQVETTATQGWTFFFYGDERKLPFATLGTRNDAYDTVSDLNREGVFRLNIGVKKETYEQLFGPAPKGALSSAVFDREYDFKALDTLMPHPTYAQMYWICVLNPAEKTWERVTGLLQEAYEIAKARSQRK